MLVSALACCHNKIILVLIITEECIRETVKKNRKDRRRNNKHICIILAKIMGKGRKWATDTHEQTERTLIPTQALSGLLTHVLRAVRQNFFHCLTGHPCQQLETCTETRPRRSVTSYGCCTLRICVAHF